MPLYFPAERLLAAAASESFGSNTRYTIVSPAPANPHPSHSACFNSPLAESGWARISALYLCDSMSHRPVVRTSSETLNSSHETDAKTTTIAKAATLWRRIVRKRITKRIGPIMAATRGVARNVLTSFPRTIFGRRTIVAPSEPYKGSHQLNRFAVLWLI